MKRHPLLKSLFFSLIILLFAAGTALAAPVGRVTHVEGRVDVLKVGQSMARPVSAGQPVDVGDIFRTKSRSKAEIIFLNKNILRIAAATRIEIKEYMTQGNRSSTVMRLERGRAQAVSSEEFIKRVSAFAEGNKLEIHTPNAVAGIRGSNMIVFHERGLTGVLFVTGKGYTFNPHVPRVIVPIIAGNISFIQTKDTPPTPPRPASSTEVLNQVNAVTPTEKPKDEKKKTEEAKTDEKPKTIAKTDEKPKDEGKKDEKAKDESKPSGKPSAESPKIVEASKPADTNEQSKGVDIVAKADTTTSSTTTTTTTTTTEPTTTTPTTTTTTTTTTEPTTTTPTTPTTTIVTPPIDTVITPPVTTTTTTTIQTPTVYIPPPPPVTDVTPPTITASGVPASATNVESATITLSGMETGAKYEYSTDGGSTWTTTTGTISYPSLAEGSYTLNIRATDTVGNTDTKTYTWTVDRTPPVVSAVLSIPASPSQATNQNVTVTVKNTEVGTSYSYSLGSITGNITGTGSDVNITLLSTNLKALGDGSQTLLISATDAAGNSSSTPASVSWSQDFTPPAISASGAPTGTIGGTTGATITLASTETGATYNYTVGSISGSVTGTGGSVPISLTNDDLKSLGDGSKTLQITATDSLGNATATPTTFSWTQDFTPPTISAYSRSATPTTGNAADIGVAITASESSTVYYSTDEGANWSATTPNLSPGSYSLMFKAVDDAGNESEPSSPIDFTLSRYSLSGNFYGCIAGVTGTVTGEVAGISSQSWGGWFMNMTGTGSSTPNPSWTVYAGGRSTDSFTSSNTNGYWISIASGTSDYDAKTLSGTSQFKYLSLDRWGTGTGTFTGTYTSEGYTGYYTLTDSGNNYTETPLTLSGSLGSDTLYYLGEGMMAAGDDYGTIGLIQLAADTYELQAIGNYSLSTSSNAYLWNTWISGGDVASSGETTQFNGYIGGLWTGGDIDGYLAALYANASSGTAGILSGSLSGKYYDSIGFWTASGSSITAQSLPLYESDPSTYSSDSGSVSGPLSGTFTSNAEGSFSGSGSGSTLFFVTNGGEGNPLPWGVYNFTLGSGNNYSLKPSDPANWPAQWSAMVGGSISDYNNGYWLATAKGTWTDSGLMLGTVGAISGDSETFGRFLTSTAQGTIGGPFYGISHQMGTYENGYGYGTWIGQSIGTYVGTPLTLSGYWGSDSLYYNSDGYFSYAGEDYGLVGLTLREDGKYDLLAMGEHYYESSSDKYLWNTPIYGWDVATGSTTYFEGYTGGLWKHGWMHGYAAALYKDGSDAGTLTGSISGKYYDSIGMWMAQGTMTPQAMPLYGSPASYVTQYGEMNASLAGSFGSGTGSIWGGSYEGSTLYFVNDNGSGTPLPWGVYNLQLGSGNTYESRPPDTSREQPTTWSAKIGGSIYNYYDDGESEHGYLIATIKGTWNNRGVIKGTLGAIEGDSETFGRYLTTMSTGTIGGPFFGINCENGTWIGQSIGTYVGTPLIFSAVPSATEGMTKSFGYWNFYSQSSVFQTYVDEILSPLSPIEGQLGATTSLFTNLHTAGTQQLYDPASITGMGTYTSNSYPLVSTTFDAYNLSGGDFGESDGVQLFFAGIHVNDQLKGKLRGLYWKYLEDGYYETGLLSTNFTTASLYPSIGMWELPATDLTAEMKGTVGPLEGQPVIGLTQMDGQIGAAAFLRGGARSFYSDNSQTTRVPWGLMSGSFGGSGTIPASADTVNAGGRFLNDSGNPVGYWLAKFTALAPDSDGFFTGTIADGRYITLASQGTASGTFAGLQNETEYQGIFGLPYSGDANLITGQTTSVEDNAFKSWDFTLTNPHNIESGTFKGIFGSTVGLLPSGTATISAMGTYTNPDARPLWGVNIAGSDTAAGMTILGRMGGTVSGSSLDGMMVALGIRTDGGVNYAYQLATPAGLSGSLYSSIGMWEASGDMGIVRGGLETSVAPADLFEGNTATPGLTWNGGRGYDADPLLGRVAGLSISGYFRPQSIGLDLINSQFLEIHYGEAGGSYTGTPQVGDTFVSGMTELKSDNVTVEGYNISHSTLTSWADGKFTASSTGRTLLKNYLVEYTTTNYGIYADGQWQAAFAGTGLGAPLAMSGTISGGLASTVSGSIVSKEYHSPYIRYNGGLDELRYETVYFKPDGASYDSTRMFAFEKAERVQNAGTSGEFTYKDEYDYFANDRYVKIRKGWGVTSMGEGGATSALSPVPDFSKDPPDTPSTHVDTTKLIYPYTAEGAILEGQYVKIYEDSWTGVTSLVRGENFTGLLGVLTGANTLWTSSSEATVDTVLLGAHGSYSGSQIFKTTVLGNLTSGGFYSQLLGIIPDTTAAEKPLEGMVIGLYVNPAGTEAGVVKGDFTGTSYSSIGMWEGDGSLYRIPMATGATGTFTQPWTDDGYGGYAEVYRGPIGPAVNSGLRGSFGSGVGVIDTPIGIMGQTSSIVGQPDWGIYSFSIGALNTYTKPAGSPDTWTATLFGSGWFGRYDTYADAGLWKATISDGTWTDGKLYGTLGGEFVTYTKVGTIEGVLKGTYDTSSWQAVSAGTWVKTQPVLFSSEVWSSSYILRHQQAGSKNYDGGYYNYAYVDQGSDRYGYGEYTDGSGNKTVIEFDQSGPTNTVRYKNVWTYNASTGNYTLTQTTYADDASYWAAMTSLQQNPVLLDTVTPHDQWYMDDWGNTGGIMAGLDNLWANLGSSTPTYLKFLGDLDSFDAARVGFNTFGGSIVSFDPRVSTDPYTDSQTPTVTVDGTDYYGAYSGYVGGVVNSSNAIDGFLKAIYMDKNRNVGIMYGSLAGTAYPYPGMWEATGSVLTYQMNAAADIPSDWDTHNFATKLTSYSNQSWRNYYPVIVAENVDSGSITMGADISQGVGFGFGDSEPGWRLSFIIPGGSYAGTPTKWTMTFDDPNVSHLRRNFLTANITHLPGNAFSGNVAGAGVERYYDGSAYQAYTSVMGGDFKGVFNPDSTWKSLILMTEMRTDRFLDRMDLMDEAARQAFEAATQIPSMQVGTATLSGAGNNMNITLPNLTFLRFNSETMPRIWAVKGITGYWSGAPVTDTAAFTISGSGLSALFNMRQWGDNAWWASIDSGSGILATEGDPLQIAFKGATAGSYSGETSGDLSGTGSGIVTESQIAPLYSGNVITGSFGHYCTLTQTMVYEGSTNITGTLEGATSFLTGDPPNYTTVTDMTASGTYTTSGGNNTLFGMNITGTGTSLGSNGFLNLRFGGIRNADTIEGTMAGFYAKYVGDGYYDTGLLVSNTLTGTLYPETGTWEIPSGSLTATFKETLPALPVVTHETWSSGLVGGDLSGSSLGTSYSLYYNTTSHTNYMNWGIWTMAAGGSGTPASSWTARSGRKEINEYGITSYSLMTITGTAASDRIAGTMTGYVMNQDNTSLMSGSLLGTYTEETTWGSKASGTTQDFYGVTYGNGKYVAVGWNGTILTSTNGTTWTAATSGTTQPLWGINYVNGQYVALGSGGTILTSTDGTTWTAATSGTSNSFLGITYANGQYVAVGDSGTILTSANGTTWTAATSGTTQMLFNVTYANGQYVAVGLNGTILTSANGTTWTAATSGTTQPLLGITYASGRYVAVGSSGTILTSTDGVTWTAATSGTTQTLNGVTYANGKYMAVGSDGTILTSTNGTAWIAATSGTTQPLKAVAYGNGQYIAVSEGGTMLAGLIPYWQAIGIGTYDLETSIYSPDSTTKAFSSLILNGATVKMASGSYKHSEYWKGVYTSAGYFDRIRYDRFYFDEGSTGTDNGKGFRWEEPRMFTGSNSSYVSYNYVYLPHGTYLKWEHDVDRITARGYTSTAFGSFDLSSNPPTSSVFDSWAQQADPEHPQTVATPENPFVQPYYKVSQESFDAVGAVGVGTFSGIMVGLPSTLGTGLWNTTASDRTQVSFLGDFDATGFTTMYNATLQSGRVSMTGGVPTFLSHTTPDGGAYCLGLGAVVDTTTNTLKGLGYGLYIDTEGQAGYLRLNLTSGSVYNDILMWEAAGTLYAVPKSTSTIAPEDLYANVVSRATIVDGSKGSFTDSSSSWINQFGWGWGRNISIAGQDWGSITLSLTDQYYNPDSKTSASMRLYGQSEFGRIPGTSNFDTGVWLAEINNMTWQNGLISGTMDGVYGKFMTYTKMGELKDGEIIGVYTPTSGGYGGYQAIAAGAWEKTQDLSFSSEIQGNSYQLRRQHQGNASKADGSYFYYSYDYNDTYHDYPSGSNSYTDMTTGAEKRVQKEYDYWGPAAEGYRYPKVVVWTRDDSGTYLTNSHYGEWTYTDGGTYTDSSLATDVSTPPDGFGTPTSSYTWDGYMFQSWGYVDGIMGGVGSLWTANDTSIVGDSVPIYLLGSYSTDFLTTNHPYFVFDGRMLSFNPATTLEPTTNTTSPLGGAYYLLFGGVLDAYQGQIGANMLGLYVDDTGSRGGILKGSFSGTAYPPISIDKGAWEATGTLYPVQMTNSLSGVDTANFQEGGSINFSSTDSYAYNSDNPGAYSNYFIGTSLYMTTGGVSRITGIQHMVSASIAGTDFGVGLTISGGSIDAVPSGAAIDRAYYTDYYNSGSSQPYMTKYIYETTTGTQLSSTMGTLTGTATGVGVNWTSASVFVSGADIKGVFDPTNLYWQAVSMSASVEASRFIELASTEAGRAALNALNMPSIQVGKADLTSGGYISQSGGSMSVDIKDVAFFAYPSQSIARIFASAATTASPTSGVSGSYTGTPATGWVVPLTGSNYSDANISGLAADFQIKNWNTGTSKWGAGITSTGAGVVNGQNINFNGGAAGAITSSSTFSGKAAGVVTPR